MTNSSPGPDAVQLKLFVAGDEPNSCLARANLQRICNGEPGEAYPTEIVNVLEDYQTALEHGILVTPCLLVLKSESRVLVAGTLKDTDKIRQMLLM